MRKTTGIIIIVLVFIALGLVIYDTLTKSQWDGRNRINIVLNQDPVTVFSLSLKDQKMVLLTIPDGTYIETINGYGFYRVESLYSLGDLVKLGGPLLAGSLQEYLGVPIDGYLTIQPCQTAEVREKRICLLERLWALMWSAKQTNLSRWDLVRLWWGIRQIRLSKIKVVDLCQNQNCDEVELPDGSKVWQLASEDLHKLSSNLLADSQIKDEGLSVAVLNGTSHYGLANRGARILTSVGTQILKISDWDNKTSVCEIRGAKKVSESYTFKKIQKLFDCRRQEEDVSEHRVDILVILGENYWDKLTKRKENF